eukprot:TRINITY_DN15665_c0_g1_i4.p1 TRINITY_DN15665_c0_g1~~TRINITY_DN15665_c0_g1_i4.p1  ORF type:complete len:356 (-),score=48.42 TRINITY_DN15665_c0_g1_i4:48-1115(-)
MNPSAPASIGVLEPFLPCKTCNASGKVGFLLARPCKLCDGTGKVTACGHCGGSGRVGTCGICGSNCGLLQRGIDKFNVDFQSGLEYFRRCGLIGEDAKSFAEFIGATKGFDKRKLGMYLSMNQPFNVRVLSAFLESHDFAGQSLPDALTFFLARFELSAEAHTVNRIVEQFSAKFFSDSIKVNPEIITCTQIGRAISCTRMSGEEAVELEIPEGCAPLGDWLAAAIVDTLDPNRNQSFVIIDGDGCTLHNHHAQGLHPFSTSDSVFVMCYSLIMLSVDLSNPTIKNHMSRDQFVRSNRGIDDGNDLPTEYVESLYDYLAGAPIVFKHKRSFSVCNVCGAERGTLCAVCGGDGTSS